MTTSKKTGKPGFRYINTFDRPEKWILEDYHALMDQTGCLTGNVGDALGRRTAMKSHIKPLAEGMKIIGSALTVRVPSNDNLMIHKALSLTEPGDVLVIDAGGDHDCALLGFLMISTAIKLKLGGIVIDGCIRDAVEIKNSQFPIFSAGINPNGPSKEGPGEINFPIACAGQMVCSGDLIVADDDGVVVVQKEFIGTSTEKIRKIITNEEKRMTEIENGLTTRPGLDDILKNKGVC